MEHFSEENLAQILPLLSESAGFDVSLEDEVECLQDGGFGIFESLDGNISGFARAYPIGDNVYLGEVYSPFFNPTLLVKNLLQSFPDKIIRFDLSGGDVEAIEEMRSCGFNSHKRFLYFDIQLTAPQTSHSQFRIAKIEDLTAVQKSLSELHRYSDEELKESLNSNNFLVLEDESDKVVAAAKVAQRRYGFEIIEFAVEPDQRRNGHGEALVQALQAYASKDAHQLFLKVEDSRVPAIQLYKKCGMIERPEKSEIWLYRQPERKSL